MLHHRGIGARFKQAKGPIQAFPVNVAVKAQGCGTGIAR
jgi:hypothetical protein